MIGREATARDGLDESDKGSKDFNEPLIGYFLTSAGTNQGGTHYGVVVGISGKLLDVTARPAATLVGQTEGPKSILFSTLYCFASVEIFWVMSR